MQWKKIDDEFPPVGEFVITVCGGQNWPNLKAQELLKGSYIHGQDPSLFYWSSGDDFNEVTHWAVLPQLPGQSPAETVLTITETESVERCESFASGVLFETHEWGKKNTDEKASILEFIHSFFYLEKGPERMESMENAVQRSGPNKFSLSKFFGKLL